MFYWYLFISRFTLNSQWILMVERAHQDAIFITQSNYRHVYMLRSVFISTVVDSILFKTNYSPVLLPSSITLSRCTFDYFESVRVRIQLLFFLRMGLNVCVFSITFVWVNSNHVLRAERKCFGQLIALYTKMIVLFYSGGINVLNIQIFVSTYVFLEYLLLLLLLLLHSFILVWEIGEGVQYPYCYIDQCICLK